MTVAGVLLAGGRSRRFGRDKALEPFAGRPLAHWSLEVLRPVADFLAVSGPSALADRFALPAIADPADAAPGPLAGIIAAMAWAAAHGCAHLLTVPCDTPFLPVDLGARLLGAIGAAPVAAARAGGPHPLCALWRVDLAPRLEPLAREADQPPLHRLIEQLGGVFVAFPDAAAFANLNTQGEFATAAMRQADRGAG
jgi:molybdopterin-guanine dinucleotide biosynthesis protein A